MALNKRIVYTRHRGTVMLVCPMPETFVELQSGAWADMPNGFVDEQIDRQIKDGIHPDHAARYARAMALGGVTESDVWEIIKDRDCARWGTLHELHHLDDIPSDRWFRDAWYRSKNGGPIGIDLAKAKPIQWQKARQAVAVENRRREEAFKPLPLISPPWETLRSAMRHARDEGELRRIWPEELPRAFSA